MKHILISGFSFFLLLGHLSAQGLVFQDTVFTDPVTISDQVEFVTFQNCRFVNISGVALTITNSGALVSDCTFNNVGVGILLENSEIYLLNDTLRNVQDKGIEVNFGTIVVQGCLFSEISKQSMNLFFCDLAEIENCTFEDVGEGINAVGNTFGDQLSILNSRFKRINGLPAEQGSGSAIKLSTVGTVEIRQNVIDSCLAYGLFLDQTGTPAENLVIQGNIISRTDYTGIFGLNAAKSIIRDNEVSYPGFLDGDIFNLDVSCIYWSGTDARIENNHLHHALKSSVLEPGSGILAMSSATIVRNRIHDCAGNGIQYSNLSDAGTEPLLIFNNVIYDVKGHPVFYDGTTTNDFSEPVQTIIRNNTLHAVPGFINPYLDVPLLVCCNENPVSAQGNILMYEGILDTSIYLVALPGAIFTESLNIKVPGDIDFVDYAGRDFHLASTNSPAHNFLPLNFGLPNDDFDGNPRIGQHDAGAFELISADTMCGCTNCPSMIPDLFFGDFIYSVRDIASNDLASPAQGVCGVRVGFEHEYVGDITMDLISPSGQSVRLIGPTGFFTSTDGDNWDIGFTTCNGDATPDPGFSAVWHNNQSWGTGANYTGVYLPANGCLEEFDFGSVTGDWTLRVFDYQASDTGVVYKFEMLFCDMTAITCQPCSNPPQTSFTSTLVGAWSVALQNQTTGGITQYQINYGDGFTASGHSIPTFHTYSDTGDFQIRLIAFNECGADTSVQTIHILGALPIAFVSASPTEGCTPLEVQLGNTFFSDVDQWHWICPGGNPSESFEAEPVITYNNPGSYQISVIISNIVGDVTLDSVITIMVEPGLINPSFSTQVIGDSIICTNTTQNATSFFWTSPNGDPVGVDTSPMVFEVDATGVYTIGLTVFNPCETQTVVNNVTVIISAGANLETAGWQFALSPNPNDGRFHLTVVSPEETDAKISILNALGQEVYSERIQTLSGRNTYPVQLGELPSGPYHLHFRTEKGNVLLRFVLR